MENTAEIQELRDKLRLVGIPQDDIINFVRRQQQTISKQKAANQTLKDEISQFQKQLADICQNNTNVQSDPHLQMLSQAKKQYSDKLSLITNDYTAENQKKQKLQDSVSLVQSKHVGMNSLSKKREQLHEDLSKMQNRLQNVIVQYNKNLKTLENQRQHLDDLRQDKSNFRHVLKKVIEEKETTNEKVAKHISESNEAYSDRDAFRLYLSSLEASEKTDQEMFMQEMSRLQQTIDTKKMTHCRTASQEEYVPSVSSSRTANSDQIANDELQKQIDEAQSQLNDIFCRVNFKTVSDILNYSHKLDQDNFSLYKFVVDHGAHSTELDEELTSLQEEIQKKQKEIDSEEKIKAEEVSALSIKIEKAKTKIKTEQNEREHEESCCVKLFKDLNILYEILGLSWDDTPDESKEITFGNSNFILSSIDRELTNLVDTFADIAKLKCEEEQIDLTSDPASVPLPLQSSTIQYDTLQKSTEFVKPLSLEELRKLV